MVKLPEPQVFMKDEDNNYLGCCENQMVEENFSIILLKLFKHVP